MHLARAGNFLLPHLAIDLICHHLSSSSSSSGGVLTRSHRTCWREHAPGGGSEAVDQFLVSSCSSAWSMFLSPSSPVGTRDCMFCSLSWHFGRIGLPSQDRGLFLLSFRWEALRSWFSTYQHNFRHLRQESFIWSCISKSGELPVSFMRGSALLHFVNLHI